MPGEKTWRIGQFGEVASVGATPARSQVRRQRFKFDDLRERPCPHCGELFLPRKRHSKFCSNRCRGLAYGFGGRLAWD